MGGTVNEAPHRTKRAVHGIQEGLAVVSHRPEETGFCSLRTFTFDGDGRPTVTVLDLDEAAAHRLIQALATVLDQPRTETP